MKIQTGIWLDTRNAHIVRIQGDQVSSKTIESEVESFNPRGGYGGANKQMPQDAISEQKMLERRKSQLTKYFQEIMELVSDSDEILIIGPGEVKLGLEKEMKKRNDIGAKIVAVQPADSMTENQIVAKVKAFFA